MSSDVLIKVQPGRALIESQDDLLKELFRLAGVQQSIFQSYYQEPIIRFSEFVQGLPASESHHHSYRGGLLEHALTTAVYGLRLRRQHVLPRGGSPEEAAVLSDTYSYAIFVGCLLHDAGKVLTDIEVRQYSWRKKYLGVWNPFGDPLTQAKKTKYYSVAYIGSRRYENHGPASLMSSGLFPAEGWAWLRSEPGVFSELMAVFTEEESDVQTIVKQADRQSVATSLGADHAPAEFSQGKPLHRKVGDAIRQVLSSGELSWNKQGANCYSNESHVFVMSKILVDAVRGELTKEGHSGVPNDNNRMFDIMSEHGLIELMENGKANWRIQISLGDWNPPVFSMVKISLGKVMSAAGPPPSWNGEISVEKGKEPEAMPENVKDSSQAKPTTSAVRALFGGEGALDLAKPTTKAEAVPEQNRPIENDPTAFGSINNQSERSVVGKAFVDWLANGIAEKTISVNTSKSFIHYLEIGVGIVSPKVFKEFALRYASLSWEHAQKSFQAQKVNLKNKDSNVFTFTSAAARKMNKTNFWVIPYEDLGVEQSSIKVNDHFIGI